MMKAKTNLPITFGSRTLQRFAYIIGFAVLFVCMSQVAAAAYPLSSANLAVAAVISSNACGCCQSGTAQPPARLDSKMGAGFAMPRLVTQCNQYWWGKKCFYITQYCYIFLNGMSACYPYNTGY